MGKGKLSKEAIEEPQLRRTHKVDVQKRMICKERTESWDTRIPETLNLNHQVRDPTYKATASTRSARPAYAQEPKCPLEEVIRGIDRLYI